MYIENITFSYGRRTAPVFTDFSLHLEPGGIYGLLGKNGTGKSTLLYLMAGLLRARRGHIRFEDRDVTRRRPETLREIFIVPEEFELPAVTMREYARLYEPFYPRFDHGILDECLADFELDPAIRLGSLSMGQKKKAYMAFALAAGTRLILMDEPTNGLDIPSKSLFRQVVSRHLTEERTFVISTHQVRDVEMLLDHLIMIDGSCLLLNASTADICAALRFEHRPVGSPVDDVFFVQPSLQGNAVVTRNEKDDDTSLDLELLFNALLAHPEIVKNIHA